MSAPLIVIACGAQKDHRSLAHPVPAAELYIGSLFTSSLRWARSVAADTDIRILSAKHGLVRLDQPLAFYDVRLGDPDAIGPGQPFPVAPGDDELVRDRPVVVVGGKDYVALARCVWPDALSFAEESIAGRVSLGALRSALRTHMGQIPHRVSA